jgi:hypothetical protein
LYPFPMHLFPQQKFQILVQKLSFF